jgi:hypothetical protein
MIKYRYRCSGYATVRRRILPLGNRLLRPCAGELFCYLTDNLGRRPISDTLSRVQDYTPQTNFCLSDIGVKSLVSRLRISRGNYL